MADLKISELTNLTAADPANDMIPIVDVSATPPASGTTKRISINNILACSPSATLASATITGDLTVDTSTLKVDSANNRVGVVQATPLYPLDITGTANGTAVAARVGYGVGGSVYSGFRFENTSFSGGNSEIRNYVNGATGTGSELAFFTTQTGGSTLTERYRFDINGVHTWSNVGGGSGTAMTLNSTGLGVGASPTSKLTIGTAAYAAGTLSGTSSLYSTVAQGLCVLADGFNVYTRTGGDRFILDSSGNVGIGVTPSYKLHVNGRISYSTGIGEGADLTLSSTGTQVQHAISSTWTSQNFYTGGTSRVVMKQNGQVRFVPLAADPAGAEAGDVYYNSTSNKLKCYNGTTWNDLF